jgi:hypothetical protein
MSRGRSILVAVLVWLSGHALAASVGEPSVAARVDYRVTFVAAQQLEHQLDELGRDGMKVPPATTIAFPTCAAGW